MSFLLAAVLILSMTACSAPDSGTGHMTAAVSPVIRETAGTANTGEDLPVTISVPAQNTPGSDVLGHASYPIYDRNMG